MAIIRPFKALRPKKDLVAKVACKPYDTLNSEEARIEAKGNEFSFLRIDKSEIDLPVDIDIHDDKVYQKAKENIQSFKGKGILIKDETPKLYIYAQIMNNRTQYGITACVSTEEYEKEIIKKHEFTRRDKEDDRVRHIEVTNCQTGMVFLTYPDSKDVNDVVEEVTKNQKPEYDFIDELNVKNIVWVIEDKYVMQKLIDAFKKIPTLYIADGHHRSAAATRVAVSNSKNNPKHNGHEEYNFFVADIFPASHLMIMDYNRIVKDLNGRSSIEFLAEVRKSFDIEETKNKKPKSQKEFGMFLDGKWFVLKAKKGTFNESDPIESLDVSILQNNLLKPLLAINDPRTDKRIDFVGGIRGVEELEKHVNSGKFKVAFSMFPTTIEQLIKVADAGMVMPPKSTWFEPKLKSGLLVHELD